MFSKTKKVIFILLSAFFLLVFSNNIASAQELPDLLKGRILLQVEAQGQAWYLDPSTKQRAFLGKPEDAFMIMRELGLGITNKDLAKIALPGEKDGDLALAKRISGKIILQVESRGEAYYINPVDLKKYYLGRPADAFNVMRTLGLGITNTNLNKITISQKYNEPVVNITNNNALDRIEEAIEAKLKR